MRAYYFSTNDKKLSYGDNRLIEKGITHTVDGKIKLCEHGLHGSEKLLDALIYAPGTILWIVELNGEIIKGNDKCVASSRTYIEGGYNIESVLKEFARKVALINIEKIKPYCSSEDYDLICHFLATGDNRIAKVVADIAYDIYWPTTRATANTDVAYAVASAARAAHAATIDVASDAYAVGVACVACVAYAAARTVASDAYATDVAYAFARAAVSDAYVAYVAYVASNVASDVYATEYNKINKMLEQMVEEFISSQNN